MSGAVVVTTATAQPAIDSLGEMAVLLSKRSAPYGFVSLVLAGSLARGEESLLLAPAGPQLFNDVDLVLVTDRPVPEALVSSWAEEATRLIAPDSRYTGGRLSPLGLHVDLAVLPRRRLRRLPCTLFNFDLQSARVLAGKEVLAELPSFRPSDIPAREALLLLGNRCLSLCESAGHPEANTAQWMYYHALKAIIDAGAALMILSGRYRTSHWERLPLLEGVLRTDFPSLLVRCPHLLETVDDAVSDRRRLRADLGWGEAVARWRQARDVITHSLRCSLARVLGLSEQSSWALLTGRARRWWISWEAPAQGRRLPAAVARWASLRVAGRPRRLLAQAAVYAAAPHLLLAIEPGGESPPECRSDLTLAKSYLSKLAREPMPDRCGGDWGATRDVAIDCWKNAA